MAGGGQPKKINWSALTLGFNVLVLVLGSLMAYAYINGGTAARLDALDRRVSENANRLIALEHRR